MEMIDLSRDLFHRTQVHPSHPPVIVSVWYDHAEKKRAGNTEFSSKALSIAFSDHAGTHLWIGAPWATSIASFAIDGTTGALTAKGVTNLPANTPPGQVSLAFYQP